MAQVWEKIGHADEKHKAGSILSLQIPFTWPSSYCDEDQISALDDPKNHNTGERLRHHKKLPFI
eukprot:1015908-Ditylum_brightwellii.AAC.1